ncbi:FecR family protein [Chitinophaga arvensicola]|uniref:FecR protein n=1 Tax=Chitinophaga arvensicola TaxID=29529 RepID=A0A1I0S8Z9_9BACT|nr:FecR family protein [Chitinophaga arvensicola]SEW52620.1 FecR protein [Chitinophaga arvensicola]
MDHQFNVAEDFLLDDSFLGYCIGINENDVQHWEKWIIENPEKRPAFDRARYIFDTVNGQQGRLDVEVNRFRSLLQDHITRTATDISPAKVRAFPRWRAAAAAVLLLATGSAGWYYYETHIAGKTTSPTAIASNDVLPGGSRARLVMGDGTEVVLDSLNPNGLLEKDGTRIGKDEGKLVYDGSATSGDQVTFNTLSTPRGGEYQLVLPDGTKVWLNAASSLRFPTKFTGADRTVYLTGEAYFEVAQQAAQPFHVQLNNGLKIAVLGTAFNVMAYDDENTVNTTLVTGKVKVAQPNGKSVVLLPAQQAILEKDNQELDVSDADIDKILAWKMGMFEFDDDDLSTVMRQLARWYDVKVTFEGPVPDKHYTGSIRKQSTLSQALRILKTAGIQFNIEGKQIIVEVK